MPKKRHVGKIHTPLVRASIIGFLNSVEYATQEEIGNHLEKDDSLPLSKRERRHVGFSVLKMPVFIKTKSIGEKDKNNRVIVLWKNNSEWRDWREEYKLRG
jgi:hypothetical protein